MWDDVIFDFLDQEQKLQDVDDYFKETERQTAIAYSQFIISWSEQNSSTKITNKLRKVIDDMFKQS